MNIQQEIAARKERLKLVKRQAAEEFIMNGRTKRFRCLWEQAGKIENDIDVLEELTAPYGTPVMGFAADLPPDTDEDDSWEDKDGEGEEIFTVPVCQTAEKTSDAKNSNVAVFEPKEVI